MTKHKHADLLIAYANNSSLKFERQNPDGHWVDAGPIPAFIPYLNYRIKTEPKKAYVFMNRKENSNSRWFSQSYDTIEDAQEYWEQMVRFGYTVTDIKEVEFV